MFISCYSFINLINLNCQVFYNKYNQMQADICFTFFLQFSCLTKPYLSPFSAIALFVNYIVISPKPFLGWIESTDEEPSLYFQSSSLESSIKYINPFSFTMYISFIFIFNCFFYYMDHIVLLNLYL